MKRVPKVVQCDKRGQIVIPKDVRADLDIDESTAFWVYSIEGEGILLKKAEAPELVPKDKAIKEISEKAGKIGVKRRNVNKAIKSYKKTKKGNLELI